MTQEDENPKDAGSTWSRFAFTLVDAIEELHLAPRDTFANHVLGSFVGPGN